MDVPFYGDPAMARRARAPIALWMLICLIGVVLGVATVATAFAVDTRDFATRHGSVLATQAL